MSGYLSNLAKEYLDKYRQSRKPRFRIKTWEQPQLEHLTRGRRSFLHKYDLIKEKYKIRSLAQIRKADIVYRKRV